MVNGLTSLQSLLHLNHKVHSINNHLHQLHLSHQVHCRDHISKLQKYIIHCCHTPLICPDGPCWRCRTPLPQLQCPHHQSHAFAAAVSPVYLQNEGARAEGGVRMGSKQVAYEWCIPYGLSIWLHMRQLQDSCRICLLEPTLLRCGILMCTPALSPVPRLEGQVRMYPRCSFHINSWLSFLISRSTYTHGHQSNGWC